jgi:hypothetical protein
VERTTSAAGPCRAPPWGGRPPLGLASGGGAVAPTPVSFSPMCKVTGGGLEGGDAGKEQRGMGEEKRGMRPPASGEWGLGFQFRRWEAGRDPTAAYICCTHRWIQRLGRSLCASNGRREKREGEMLGRWQARPPSCLRPGRLRAALYRAVPRAGPTGRGGGPGTKRPSGRAGTRHYRSGLGSGQGRAF